MNRSMIVPSVFGVVGVAILLWLGVWQLHRLEWKRAFLNEIEARIHAPAVALPVHPDRARDKFLSVVVAGRIEGPEIHVLAGRKNIGPGYRVVTALTTKGGRRVLLDRGFVGERAKNTPRPAKTLEITGNLHWPEETDSFTPAPDMKANIWFARDVDAMARTLGTEPTLIVASSDTGDGIEPFPVGTDGIPNDHLQYAITWFLLAGVWLGMTLYLLWRIKRKTN